ncbi:MAG: thiolase family protein [Planctomycetes bacterium]|nr:thiolase family protein [Planctomycetota bacterium]
MSDVSVVVVDGVRTPFVKAGADLSATPAWELGRAATRELLARAPVAPSEIDEVIFGCVAQPSDAANVARVIALRAGVSRHVPALTVGRNCASGMEAVTLAAERIRSGRAKVILAGGVEAMSGVPLEYPPSFARKLGAFARARGLLARLASLTRFRPRDFRPVIALEKGLTDPICGEIMGLTAERLAREFGIGREEQDRFALQSHQRALAARARFGEEIAPFAVPPGLERRIESDLGPREGQSLEALARLRPFFDRSLGSVTVGNSCPVTDGAVALLIMSEERARAAGARPLGRIRSHAYRGCDPARMGLGPAFATPPALAEAGISFAQLRRIELNEAFAAQVIACLRAFASPAFARDAGWSAPLGEVDPAILNPNGGAIALGHPVGATGARLVLTLLRELRRIGGGLGLATLCVGGGQGGAVVVEGLPS